MDLYSDPRSCLAFYAFHHTNLSYAHLASMLFHDLTALYTARDDYTSRIYRHRK